MKNKGFTLIELLVVISIIGVLATVVLSSLTQTRATSRDAKRLADIRTIQSALEVYYINNGTYPITSWQSSHNSSWDNLESLLGTRLPVDPLNTSEQPADYAAAIPGEYVYGYFGHPSSSFCSGLAYMLVFNLETKSDTSRGVEFCNGTSYGYRDAVVVGVDLYGNFIGPEF